MHSCSPKKKPPVLWVATIVCLRVNCLGTPPPSRPSSHLCPCRPCQCQAELFEGCSEQGRSLLHSPGVDDLTGLAFSSAGPLPRLPRAPPIPTFLSSSCPGCRSLHSLHLDRLIPFYAMLSQCHHLMAEETFYPAQFARFYGTKLNTYFCPSLTYLSAEMF